MNDRHIPVGARVRITSSDLVVEGTRTYGEGTNYGTDDKPNWYITMEDDNGMPYYWKQEYDGGTLEILDDPNLEAAVWDVVETSSDYVDEVDYEEANRQYTTGEYELPASEFARADGITLTTPEQDKEVLSFFNELYQEWLNQLPKDRFDQVQEIKGGDIYLLVLNWWSTGNIWESIITDVDENDIPF